MPILRIETNQDLTDEQKQQLLEKSTDMLCRVLDKPKTFMMVYIDAGCCMLFEGSADPAALIQLRLFAFDEEKVPAIIADITDFIHQELAVEPSRQYIQLTEMKTALFGWNGKPC